MRVPGNLVVMVGSILALSACATGPAATDSPAATDRPHDTPVATSGSWAGSAPATGRRPAAPSSPSSPAPPDDVVEPERKPRMLRATMSIPAIGLRAVPIVPYRGSPDDGPGTLIQNRGVAASPFGRRGGVGPGQVGNYIVTGHRTTAPGLFADLPTLRKGEHVLVTARGRVFDYRVTETRSTSFRSKRSLARQAAAVPGHLKMVATRAMVTLSTCATQEDHARGNYWADEFGNPEHRIDKIGVLTDVRRTR